MKDKFIEKRFTAASLSMIEIVNTILEEYRQMGYRLSLRQLYYQLVARDYIPNSQRSYKNIGSLISDGRQAGAIDWEMIEDRGRSTVAPTHWDNPGDIVRAAASQFRIDKWANQPWHIEVSVEKDALSGVLEPVCRRLDVGITANKGYSSSSTMYEIGQRLDRKAMASKNLLIIYLGDHDPSGIDMTRDVDERLKMYSLRPGIKVERIALNWDQVELWQPPENPAKETDARYKNYVEQYGESSWELDAVEPRTLAKLVEDTVAAHRDDDLWAEMVEKETDMRAELDEFAQGYED